MDAAPENDTSSSNGMINTYATTAGTTFTRRVEIVEKKGEKRFKG